ncbi:hypothetical protein WJX75_004409 [Coccomyxa subellipsoidea]|uniref:Uncharacterized protein n=1 Tax=Coccomyxa subellipsoidea TaxID=248742 RepID=A0ABR2YPJ2_9CHLO
MIQDPRLAHCIERVIQEATRLGVERFSCNGCCESDWTQVKELSEKYENIVPNFGLHPWWVHERSKSWLEVLRDLLLSSPHAGLGEVGQLQNPRMRSARRPHTAPVRQETSSNAERDSVGSAALGD